MKPAMTKTSHRIRTVIGWFSRYIGMPLKIVDHKHMKYLMILAFSVIAQNLFAQPADTLSLFEVYQMAQANAPIQRQLELNNSSSQLKKEAISTANLPGVSAYGKAWYQSDAVATPSFGPGMEGIAIDRFQYNLGVELDQKLFDGGITNKRVDLEEISRQINNAEVKTQLYKINDQINQNFFSVLLMEESERILKLKKQALQERAEDLSSGVQNGVILRSELDKIEAEIISVEQQETDLELTIQTLKNNLKILAGIDQNKSISLQKPDNIAVPETLDRPEYQLFQYQQQSLEKSKALKERQLLPKLFAFAQMGYSYPGLNMFENQADPYYIVGGKLSWTIFDWNKTKKENQVLDIQKQSVDIQKEVLDRNLLMAIESKTNEINSLEELMVKDRLIIEKRTRIAKASASALDNGTITSATYLDDLNAETKSRLDLKRHEIQLLQTRAELAVVKGITIE